MSFDKRRQTQIERRNVNAKIRSCENRRGTRSKRDPGTRGNQKGFLCHTVVVLFRFIHVLDAISPPAVTAGLGIPTPCWSFKSKYSWSGVGDFLILRRCGCRGTCTANRVDIFRTRAIFVTDFDKKIKNK